MNDLYRIDPNLHPDDPMQGLVQQWIGTVLVPVTDERLTRAEWEATMIRLPKEGWPESAWAALLDRHFENGFTPGERWALHLVRVDDGATEQEILDAAVKGTEDD